MYHIVCVPLVSGFPFETLSYVSKKPYEVGSLVRVTVGNQSPLACVISCDDVRNHRLEIKSREYETKVVSTEPIGTLPKELIEWLTEVSESEYEPMMNVWKGFLLENIQEFLVEHFVIPSIISKTKKEHIVGDLEERIIYYTETLWSTLSKNNQSLLIVSPTKKHCQELVEVLKEHVSEIVFIQPTFSEKIQKSLLSTSSKIIVTTPQCFLAALPFVAHLVIDDASSPFYQSMLRPRINFTDAIIAWCKKTSLSYTIADRIPSVSTFYFSSLDNLPCIPLKEHRESPVAISHTVLDSSQQKKIDEKLSLLKEKLAEHIHKQESVFIATPGNALAKRVLCRDCGAYVRCPKCNSIAELHDKPSRNFICPDCRYVFPAVDRCGTCEGSSLEMYGIGSSFVQEFFKEELQKDPNLITIGTRQELFAAEIKSIDHTYLLTPDTILVSPPYDGYEQILRVFAEASAKTRKSIISLERRDLAWVNTLLSNNTTLIEWIRKEYEVRKSMHLPPFETFLTITGYTTDKEYQKMWEFTHKESAYISLIPRLGSRIFGLDEKMTLQKSQPGRPFSLTFKVDASLFEERFFRSHKTTIVSRTKNPTYIEKEENLPRL